MGEQLTIGNAAKYLGVSPDTLRRWEKKGRVTPRRSPTNRRYYTKDQLDELLKKPSDRAKTIKASSGSQQTNPLRLVLFSLGAVLLAALLGTVLIGILD